MTSGSQPSASDAAPMEITSTRLFDAPREAVFGAFEDPVKLAQWWGPNGFTNTIHTFEFRPGGTWRFTMRAPDGATFENTCDFVEILKPARIVFIHQRPMHRFRMTMTFEDVAGKTRLTWRMEFDPDKDNQRLRPLIVDANEQNLDRLAAQLR